MSDAPIIMAGSKKEFAANCSGFIFCILHPWLAINDHNFPFFKALLSELSYLSK